MEQTIGKTISTSIKKQIVSGTITNAYREHNFNYCFHFSVNGNEKVISIPWTSDLAILTTINGIGFKNIVGIKNPSIDL